MCVLAPSSVTISEITESASSSTSLFQLISQPEDGSRDEVDLEFLGDKAGVPITLQTNVFVDGRGDREQRTRLWFDPAADFHDYKILWNPYQLV
jgi:xyloglucan:xyloglucosyl transferase